VSIKSIPYRPLTPKRCQHCTAFMVIPCLEQEPRFCGTFRSSADSSLPDRHIFFPSPARTPPPTRSRCAHPLLLPLKELVSVTLETHQRASMFAASPSSIPIPSTLPPKPSLTVPHSPLHVLLSMSSSRRRCSSRTRLDGNLSRIRFGTNVRTIDAGS
jgi:hypothetical protein